MGFSLFIYFLFVGKYLFCVNIYMSACTDGESSAEIFVYYKVWKVFVCRGYLGNFKWV